MFSHSAELPTAGGETQPRPTINPFYTSGIDQVLQNITEPQKLHVHRHVCPQTTGT